jgi:hypothetical protein
MLAIKSDKSIPNLTNFVAATFYDPNYRRNNKIKSLIQLYKSGKEVNQQSKFKRIKISLKT